MPSEWEAAIATALKEHAARVYAAHRLRYIYKDRDTDPDHVLPIFVCVCNEGFDDRQRWNRHMEEVYGTMT